MKILAKVLLVLFFLTGCDSKVTVKYKALPENIVQAVKKFEEKYFPTRGKNRYFYVRFDNGNSNIKGKVLYEVQGLGSLIYEQELTSADKLNGIENKYFVYLDSDNYSKTTFRIYDEINSQWGKYKNGWPGFYIDQYVITVFVKNNEVKINFNFDYVGVVIMRLTREQNNLIDNLSKKEQ